MHSYDDVLVFKWLVDGIPVHWKKNKHSRKRLSGEFLKHQKWKPWRNPHSLVPLKKQIQKNSKLG